MKARKRYNYMKGRNTGPWCIIQFFNKSSPSTTQQQMKIYFEVWLTGSVGRPDFCYYNGTACHSSLIYFLSLKAWHKI